MPQADLHTASEAAQWHCLCTAQQHTNQRQYPTSATACEVWHFTAAAAPVIAQSECWRPWCCCCCCLCCWCPLCIAAPAASSTSALPCPSRLSLTILAGPAAPTLGSSSVRAAAPASTAAATAASPGETGRCTKPCCSVGLLLPLWPAAAAAANLCCSCAMPLPLSAGGGLNSILKRPLPAGCDSICCRRAAVLGSRGSSAACCRAIQIKMALQAARTCSIAALCQGHG
jgi:hypothetical protein